jgi:hypothetical protein
MKSKKVREENARLVENLIAEVRGREPVMKNPEGLTEDIMNAIRGIPAGRDSARIKKTTELPAVIILRRLLAAASVCLFLVFAYDEYVVVDKISSLEKQCSAISHSSQYQAALNVKTVMNVLTLHPQLINQYLESKTKKINLQTLLKAAMFADFGGFTPDALELLKNTGYNPTNQAIISYFNNFDSTHHTIKR